MSGQPEEKPKSLLHNPLRTKIRKESKRKMKAKMAPEKKDATPTRLDEVLR